MLYRLPWRRFRTRRRSFPIRSGRMLRGVVLVISLSAAAAAFLLAQSLRPEAVNPAVVQQPEPQVELTNVLVASAELARGTRITEGNLTWQPWPKDAVRPGYVVRASSPDAPASFRNYVVRTALVAGEPVLDGKLGPPGSGSLSALLEPGKRAVAVRVSAENTAGGFILPGDRVDVIHTITKAGADGNPEIVSSTALSGIKVLAIDQTQRVDQSTVETTVLGRTATLELGAGEVEVLAAAQMTGALSLALRSASENEAFVPPSAPAALPVVRVHRGGKVETVQVSFGASVR